MHKRLYALALILSIQLVYQVSQAQPKVSYSAFEKSPFANAFTNVMPSNNRMTTGVTYSTTAPQSSATKIYTQAEFEHDLAAGNQKQEQIENDLRNDIRQMGKTETDYDRMLKTGPYYIAFQNLLRLNPDSFSVSEAIYTIEHAYDPQSKISYETFRKAIAQKAALVRQILKREGLNTKNSLALNYGIQKLFSQSNIYYDSKTKRSIEVPPLKYDFEDYRGEKDYSKMFVTKVLKTNSGQCHSLPLLYLAIAETLGAKAWLSLAPQHSFIQFQDNQGKLVNFETTNGHVVSSSWLTQSGFINAMALQNKTYLDTLSSRQLYSQMLADLMLGYVHKFGYDGLARDMKQAIQRVNPQNLTTKIMEANDRTNYALGKIKQAGTPKEEDLSKYPDAYKAYLAMQASYATVDNTGYQDMPNEAYQAWLKSIEKEKRSQKARELRLKMQKEIEVLKKLKVTLHNNNQQ